MVFPAEVAGKALGIFRRDVVGQDEMHIWQVSLCSFLLAPNLEKGSSLQVSYISVFAELLWWWGTVLGRIAQPLSAFHELVSQELAKELLFLNRYRGCSVRRMRLLKQTP